jgi:hypothetical protein
MPLVLFRAGAEQGFPEWRGSNVLVPALWTQSPIVAVGEVVNVSSYGEQTVASLPPPMSSDVHRLYWCTGEFRVAAVLKGEIPVAPRRYLWASAQPGCKLWYGAADSSAKFATRVWFLRGEGDFLRPTFDSGTHLFIGIYAKWDDGPGSAPRQRLGALLLTPSANSETLEDYANYLWDVGDIACELLGRVECARRIKALAQAGNPALREGACGFLKGQLGEDCTAK